MKTLLLLTSILGHGGAHPPAACYLFVYGVPAEQSR